MDERTITVEILKLVEDIIRNVLRVAPQSGKDTVHYAGRVFDAMNWSSWLIPAWIFPDCQPLLPTSLNRILQIILVC